MWQLVEEAAHRCFARYGYSEIRTPLFESTDLFARGIGTETDIVGKEMYTFCDRSERSLTLRPEGTAGVVRAFLERKWHATAPSPLKLWYQGPMFRYERPQKGRQRQFYQIGIEVFGSDAPAADAEVVALCYQLFREFARDFLRRIEERLGAERAAEIVLPDPVVQINTLGDAECRPRYREALVRYFHAREEEYCEDCKRRMSANPLRVLDCKVPRCAALNAGAPALEPCPACGAHFAAVCDLLERAGVPYEVDPRIVRGLDYYTRTVFELVPATAQGSQSTLCAGGRYDGLVSELGGPPTPAVGWALGCERAYSWLVEQVAALTPDEVLRLGAPVADVYVAPLFPEAVSVAFCLAQDLRAAGLVAQVGFKAAKPDKHFKHAERLGARFIALIGPDELARREVALKNLATREQASVPLDAEVVAAQVRMPAKEDLVV